MAGHSICYRVLPDEAALKKALDVTASIDDAEYNELVADDPVDYAIGFEMNFPELSDADGLKFFWDVSTLGEICQSATHILKGL